MTTSLSKRPASRPVLRRDEPNPADVLYQIHQGIKADGLHEIGICAFAVGLPNVLLQFRAGQNNHWQLSISGCFRTQFNTSNPVERGILRSSKMSEGSGYRPAIPIFPRPSQVSNRLFTIFDVLQREIYAGLSRGRLEQSGVIGIVIDMQNRTVSNAIACAPPVALRGREISRGLIHLRTKPETDCSRAKPSQASLNTTSLDKAVKNIWLI